MLHEVLTTEKVPFKHRVAGLGSRFLAWMIDFCLWVLLLLPAFVASAFLDSLRPGVGSMLLLFWQFTTLVLYYPLFEWLWQGQTPGKRVLGLRVIELRGTGLSFSSAMMRNLLRFADFLPLCYAVGGIAGLLDAKQRRLGDWAAGTLVVHDQRKAQPIRVVQGDDAGKKRADDLTSRQRLLNLTRDQKQTLLDLCLRRDQLRVADRAKLFRSLAEYLDAELGLAAEAHESDERFVLRMAALLSERGPTEADLLPARGRPARTREALK